MGFRIGAELDGRLQRFDLKAGENLIGSDPSCDVQLLHPSVSRHHAVLVVFEDSIQLADLGSANGTQVAGRRLSGKARLEPGERLSFGTVDTVLSSVDDEDTQPADLPYDSSPVLAADDEARTPESAGTPETTASVGPLHTFTLGKLPHLLDELLEKKSVADFAQSAGAALWSSLPCQSVQVLRCDEDDPGVLFAAGEGGGEELEIGDSDLRVRVAFKSESAARFYSPVVGSVVRLLEIAEGDRRGTDRSSHLAEKSPPLPEPPTVDRQMRDIYERATTVARGEITVLIRGSSGTGKEVLARYIHRASPRRDGPFVALNCAALPRDLQELELFGIERGVATGVEARAGRFEQADGGTLFLDEIGDMASDVQAKILRTLQEGEVYRLGGRDPRPAAVRVLSATNRNLEEMMERGEFRSDLYHRIADWVVTLPDLRDRPADIPNLAAYFLERESRRLGRSVRGISRAAIKTLASYEWPGNVRQLEREIARAVLFVEDEALLDTECLQEEVQRSGKRSKGSLRDYLQRAEEKEIERALLSADGDVPAAARALEVPESTLYRKIKSFGLKGR